MKLIYFTCLHINSQTPELQFYIDIKKIQHKTEIWNCVCFQQLFLGHWSSGGTTENICGGWMWIQRSHNSRDNAHNWVLSRTHSTRQRPAYYGIVVEHWDRLVSFPKWFTTAVVGRESGRRAFNFRVAPTVREKIYRDWRDSILARPRKGDFLFKFKGKLGVYRAGEIPFFVSHLVGEKIFHRGWQDDTNHINDLYVQNNWSLPVL